MADEDKKLSISERKKLFEQKAKEEKEKEAKEKELKKTPSATNISDKLKKYVFRTSGCFSDDRCKPFSRF